MKLTYLVFFYVLTFCCYAQSSDPRESQKIVPPSPNASSLGKYGSIPVSTYSGIPNIQIPIHDIVFRDINLPVSLSYHAAGYKVEEEASWAGLGWTLNAGGVITRSVVGYDDLKHGFPFEDSFNPTTINNFQRLFEESEYNHRVDVEPDIFYFNVSGHSGKFVLNKDADRQFPIYGTVLEKEKIQIICDVTANSEPGEYQWTIILADGSKFIFGTQEITLNRTNSSESGFGKPAPSQDPWFPKEQDMEERNADFRMPTAWYLDQIISPTGAKVNFEYRVEEFFVTQSVASVNETRNIIVAMSSLPTSCNGYIPSEVYSYSQMDTKPVYLKKIKYPYGEIEFTTSDRDDLGISRYANGIKPQKLENIRITEGSLDKIFDFNFNYFNPTSNFLAKRLRLESVAETSSALEEREKKPSYEFFYQGWNGEEYPASLLPPKNSKSRDHWGYFNGANNENVYNEESGFSYKTAIPSLNFLIPSSGDTYTFYGANRESSEEHMKRGVLQKIKYPTGGTTTFDFEANTIPREVYNSISGNLKPGKKYFKLTNTRPIVSFVVKEPTVLTIKGIVSCNCPTGAGCPLLADEQIWGRLSRFEQFETVLTSFNYEAFNTRGECSKSYNSIEVTLTPGNYGAQLSLLSPYSHTLELNFDKQVIEGYEPVVTNPPPNVAVGGLRLKRMVDNSVDKEFHEKIFSYSQESGSLFSSGRLFSFPTYAYLRNDPIPYTDWGFSDITDPCYGIWQTFASLSSWSNVPLGTAQGGGFVGYSTVTVYEGDNGTNGKTVLTYQNEPNSIIAASELPDFPTLVNMGNGMELKNEVYNSANFKIRETILTPHFKLGDCIQGLKRRSFGPINTGGNQGNGLTLYPYFAKNYCIQSEWWVNTSAIEHTYDLEDPTNTKFVEVISQSYFDNNEHMQLTKQLEIKNDKRLLTEMTYPLDHSDPISTSMILPLNHVHNKVVTKTLTRQNIAGSDSKVLAKDIYKYINVNDKFLVGEIFSLETTLPLAPSQCVVNANLSFDVNKFKLKESRQYYASGNLKSITASNGIVSSYVWDDQHILPIAEVFNVLPDRLFYSSFEEDGTIDLNAKTGLKVKSGDIFIPELNRPTAGSYLLTFWERVGAGWLFRSQSITYTPSTAPLLTTVNPIDELRMTPLNTSFNSFSYDGLRLISTADPNGIVSYFNYDKLGRLKNIRDNEKNIVKNYIYHYHLNK